MSNSRPKKTYVLRSEGDRFYVATGYMKKKPLEDWKPGDPLNFEETARVDVTETLLPEINHKVGQRVQKRMKEMYGVEPTERHSEHEEKG
jgi:hypothetical protein